MSFAAMMLIAVALDLAFGWPPRIYAAVSYTHLTLPTIYSV